MPFFREACQERFPAAVVVSCPEPEFSIAKGLAYAGWVDENLRAFRKAIREEITDARVSAIASESLPRADSGSSEAALRSDCGRGSHPPSHSSGSAGRSAPLGEMNDRIGARVERILSSPLAEETLAPAVRGVAFLAHGPALQAMVDPICDRFDGPTPSDAAGSDRHRRRQRAAQTGQLDGALTDGRGAGRDRERGGGPALRRRRHRLIATGPLGFVAGVAVGAG